MSTSASEKAFSKHSTEFNGKRAEIGQDIHDLGKITGSLAGDAVNVVHDNAAQYYDQGVKQAVKYEKSIEKQIQKYPLQSLLIGAGVGLVLGTLWSRR